MSPFAHGNTMEVLQSLRDIERRNDIPQRFGLSYDDDTRLVETVLPFLQFLLLLYLRFVREFLIGSADAPDRGQLGKADEAIRWAAYLLATLPKPYWKRTVDDIDYLFQILALADAGDDWRIVRDQRAPIAPRNPRGPDGNP